MLLMLSPAPAFAASPRSPSPATARTEIVGVVVVGGGPAGLAVAGALARRGIPATVLEAETRLGASWERHYDGLRLHTPRRTSYLPGARIPRRAGAYPERGAFLAYLRAYPQRLGLDVRTGCRVVRVERQGALWATRCEGSSAGEDGGPFLSDHLVVAAGFHARPRRPAVPGIERFVGTMLHTSEYHAPTDLPGSRVLVVGFGNSGADVAAEAALAGRRVALAVRGPVPLVPRRILGVPWRLLYQLVPNLTLALGGRLGPSVRRRAERGAAAFWCRLQRRAFGDLPGLGIPLPDAGQAAALWRQRRGPVTAERAVSLLRAGRIEVFPELTHLDARHARFADGRRLEIDTLVWATGFEPALDFLAGCPEALDAAGLPVAEGSARDLPGFHAVGFVADLWAIRRRAQRIARTIARAQR